MRLSLFLGDKSFLREISGNAFEISNFAHVFFLKIANFVKSHRYFCVKVRFALRKNLYNILFYITLEKYLRHLLKISLNKSNN